ncbi:ECs_2282 family putative zinc-binding protein [Enterobacteriaceae bacterium NFIX31]
MSDISFKCPACGHDLIVHSGTEISDVDDTTGTPCLRCGHTVSKDELIRQAREYAAALVSNILKKLPG